MVKLLCMLFLLSFGWQQAFAGGHDRVSVVVNEEAIEGRDQPNPPCPRANGKAIVIVTYPYSEDREGRPEGDYPTEVKLAIGCADNANDDKSEHYKGQVTLAKGCMDELREGDQCAINRKIWKHKAEIVLKDHNMTKGKHCRVTASPVVEVEEAQVQRAQVDPIPATADFKVGFDRVGRVDDNEPLPVLPEPFVRGTVTGGHEFMIEQISHYTVYPALDLLLRECTADTDPWMFWLDTTKNKLQRVYPSSVTSHIDVIMYPTDTDTTNEPKCLGAYDGQLRLVTISNDSAKGHQGCKLKHRGIWDIKGASNFTEQGAPALASAAAVTVGSGKVMVHTGAKPGAPTGIQSTIDVYISTNRGATWEASTTRELGAWTSSAQDSGIKGHSDNTRNMAMIRLTDGTNVWWRLLRGK